MSTEQTFIATGATLANATATSTAVIQVPVAGTLDVKNSFCQVLGTAINSGLTQCPLITLGINRSSTLRTVGTLTPGVGVTISASSYAGLAGLVNTDGIVASDAVGRLYKFRPAFGGKIKYPGTVSVSNGSATVTGVGTSFTTDFIVGDIILIGGIERVVTAIGSNTSITASSNYAAAQTAVTYRNGQAIAPGTSLTDGGIGTTADGKIRLIKNDIITATVVAAGSGGTPAGTLALLASVALDAA